MYKLNYFSSQSKQVIQTLDKIDSVLNEVRGHRYFSDNISKRENESLLSDSRMHSIGMEFPDLDYHTHFSQANKEVSKKASQHYKNARKAEEYLKREGLSNTSLSVLGNIVEPEGHPIKTFRDKDIAFGEFEGTNPAEIIYEIDNLVYRLSNLDIHPVILGLEGHLGLVNIHPYKDGNGRCARILQNYILRENGYTPATFPQTERGIYISLMRNTIRDRKYEGSSIEMPSENELLLHQYFADKVLTSAVKVRNDLEKKKEYKIELKGSDSPGNVHCLVKKLRAYAKSQGTYFDIEFTKSTNPVINLCGEVEKKQLEPILNDYQGNLFKNFKIKAKK